MTAKWRRFSKIYLSILGGDNFINMRFFNKDDFKENIIQRRFHEDCLKMIVIRSKCPLVLMAPIWYYEIYISFFTLSNTNQIPNLTLLSLSSSSQCQWKLQAPTLSSPTSPPENSSEVLHLSFLNCTSFIFFRRFVVRRWHRMDEFVFGFILLASPASEKENRMSLMASSGTPAIFTILHISI